MAAMSRWACSDRSTRKSMLPRKLIEEFLGGLRATCLHVLEALPDGFNSFLIILALPFEVLREHVVEGVGGTLPASASELFELSKPLRLYRERFHVSKVEVRAGDVNLLA